MSGTVIFLARQAMIAIGLIAAFLGNASASPNTLTVQDPRPVAKAIQELEKRYGWQITYEDPPYSHYSDMPDVTTSVQEGSSAMPGASHVTGPEAAILSFPLPATNQDESSTVNAVVKIYNESHRGFLFAVVQGAGVLHVVPRQMTGLSGNLEPVKPVLDAVITIAPRKRTLEEFLEGIFKKVSIDTNTHVEMGTVSYNMLHLTKTSVGGSGTARSILERWILELRGGFSWRLLYFPPDKTYSLNISQEFTSGATLLPKQ